MGETVSQEASSASKAAADIEALWSSYKKEQDIEQRNALIEHYLPLVRLVAGRLAIGLPMNTSSCPLSKAMEPSFSLMP